MNLVKLSGIGKISIMERRETFKEVYYGFMAGQAEEESKRCLQCPKPSCISGCPAHVDVKGFIEKLREGDLEASINIIMKTNLFPGVTARVCQVEKQCENSCVLAKTCNPIRIGALQRYVADQTLLKGRIKPESKPPNGYKVAVIGAGPAGLNAAGILAREGFQVDVFDEMPMPGGALVYHIPRFRLPLDVVDSEISYIEGLGVELRQESRISPETAVKLLESYDRLILATGAWKPTVPNIPGVDLDGVYPALHFLIAVNTNSVGEKCPHIKRGAKVLVIGGGEVAIDSARTALRLGCEPIIVYRRSIAEMPCLERDRIDAEEEGVKMIYLASPLSFQGRGKVEKAVFQRMKLGEPDESGRRRPIPIPGETIELDADAVLLAIGQKADAEFIKKMGLETTSWGTAVVNPDTMQTSNPKIYAAGDVVNGPSTVAKAVGDGYLAAQHIIKTLLR